jgi:prenyltransferase beta subunit
MVSIRAFARRATFLLLYLCALGSTHAQTTPQINRGVQWLASQVQADGSLLNESSSIATPLQNREEAALTLKALASIPSALTDQINAESENNTQYLSRKILALNVGGGNTATQLADLVGRQNDDGGFGGAAGYDSNVLHTAWAVLAMRTSAGGNSTAITNAVNYLLAIQDTSGGYALPGNNPSAYVSALVATALQPDRNNPQVLGVLNKISTWLSASQLADGSWGSTADTATVYLALLNATSDGGLRSRVTTFLTSKQSVDGSWGGDPYVTALALRALAAQPSSAATVGSVTMMVVDATSAKPIAGATVLLQGSSSVSSQTDTSGTANLQSVTAGSYSVTISANGYATQNQNVSVQAGVTADLGTIALASAQNTGILQGIVKDRLSGGPLSGAVISVSGSATANAMTAADGTYTLAGLASGAVTISASKNGYTSVNGVGAIVAGASLIFSPTLTPTGTNGGTAAVVGRVVDANSQAPLNGVTVSVGTGGSTAASDLNGNFNVAGLTAGTYPVSFSLQGYQSKSIGSVLVTTGSETNLQTVGLNKALNAVSILGQVVDSSTKQPIVGATITVQGSSISTVTGTTGSYRIDGAPLGGVTLKFSATGYASDTVVLNFASNGEYRVDRSLAPQSGIVSLAISADKPNYAAYDTVTVTAHVQNSGGATVLGTIAGVIVDAQGKVVDSMLASHLDQSSNRTTRFDLAPGDNAVSLQWNTLAYPPGPYTFVVKVYQFDPSSIAYSQIELAERQTSLAIDPTQAIQSAVLTPLPSYTNLNATEQVGFRLDLVNRSNIPVSSSLSYQLQTPGGTVLYTSNITVPLNPTEATKSVLLSGLQYKFIDSGLHSSSLTVTGGVAPSSAQANTISVAPGTRVDPSQAVMPSTVTPDGDKRIHLDIRLQGVQQK